MILNEARRAIMRRSNVAEIHRESVKVDRNAAIVELPNSFSSLVIGGESPDGFLRQFGIEIGKAALPANLERNLA
jgi:hypothetical protein